MPEADLLRKVREAMLAAAHATALNRMVGSSRWRQQRLLIWCFHGVSIRDEHEWNPALYLSVPVLRRRLELFASEGCQVLPFGEAVHRLREGTLPPKSIALTVDDGGYDFFCRAVPVFEGYGVPALTYLSSYYSSHQLPIFGLGAGYLLWTVRQRHLPAWPEVGIDAEIVLADAGGRASAVNRLLQHATARGMGGAEKDLLLQELASRAGADYDRLVRERLLHLMRPDEVGSVARAGFGVELHTHRHRMPVEPEAFRTELRENRRAIEAATGARPTHFCYPSGHYGAKYLPVLREEGVETATTCDVALASAGSPALLLPRFVDTSTKSEAVLAGWLSGVSTWAHRRTRFDASAYHAV
jgi:peptidoglycan/xylan/chitin deacetylase (PgdA/CDA1 family)